MHFFTMNPNLKEKQKKKKLFMGGGGRARVSDF